MAKKKHKTPDKLDYLFQRNVITKAQYHDFWNGYWDNKRARDKEKYVDKYVSDLQLSLPIGKRESGSITSSRMEAERQAKEIGGYVIRRNKKGRFSKNGSNFQAVKRRSLKAHNAE